MLKTKTKLELLERFKDACIPVELRQDKAYPGAVHVILDQKPEIQTDKILWSASVEYVSGQPRIAKTPDVAFVWAAVSFVQCTETGEKQVGQVFFPGSWGISVYNKWLILWYRGTNVIQSAHERYGLAQHRLVNRERGLLLTEHTNLDEIGILLNATRILERS